jgi:alpha-tubulin suppressor-like RCC1 family protein
VIVDTARFPRSLAYALLLAICSGGCSERPRFEPGDECELNTECQAPLVCRLEHCRVECRTQRDCAPGLECVRDEQGLGACQLPTETECELTSDCAAGLVCRFGRCTNECNDDRDCPPGSDCVEEPGVGTGCRDQSMDECELASDCEARNPLYICAVDHRCRAECREDWDCRDGMTCVQGETPYCAIETPPPFDAGLPMDAGVRVDASMADAGIPPAEPARMSARLHTCALSAPGELSCWGFNMSSELGDGTTNDSPTPIALSLTGVSVVAAGGRHTCAIATDGLYCWGDNTNGQCGTGSGMATHGMPAPVGGLPGTAVDVAAGTDHTCAVTSDNRLFCWGRNDEGELALGAIATDHATPTEVTGLSGTPVRVSTHRTFTCVRHAEGTADCFGDNYYSQLGDGRTSDVLVPQRVPGLTGVVQIGVGDGHACALRGTGEVLCWGENSFGQIGNGTMSSAGVRSHSIVGVPAPAFQLAVGGAHTCVRTAAAVYCWGVNSNYQTGNTSAFPVVLPQLVTGVGAVEELYSGTSHTCAIVDSSTSPPDLRCWGDNGNGQLGNGLTVDSATPQQVAWP